MTNTAFEIIIKPIVFLDAEEAVKYYEKKVPGLGRRFYNSFLASLTEVETKPFVHSYLQPPVRRCKIKKFPYKIFYIINDKIIVVIGLAHAKRSNAFVKRRLKL
jgi:hypothetical protein